MQLPEEMQEYAAQGLLKAPDIQLLFSQHPMVRPTMLKSIVQARQAGRTPVHVPKKNSKTRTIFHRPNTRDLQEVLQALMEKGFNGLVAKLVLFAMGRISIDKVMELIDRAERHIQTCKRVPRHDHKAEAVLYKKDEPCEENTCIPSPKNLPDSGFRVL
jgi:hypothetical protein